MYIAEMIFVPYIWERVKRYNATDGAVRVLCASKKDE